MKKKKIVTLLLIVLFVFSLTACSSPKEKKADDGALEMNVVADLSKPEGTVKVVFDAFKEKDVKTLNDHIKLSIGGISNQSNSVWITQENQLVTNSDDPNAMALVNGFTEDFSYKILGSQENGDKAEIKVQVTNRDLSKVINKLVALDESKRSDASTLVTLVNEAKGNTVTTELTLPVTKNGDKWTVNLDVGATNAILGKIMSTDLLGLMKDATGNN